MVAASMHPNLVNVQSVIPSILVDLRYASERNFTGKVIYDDSTCYLLPVVADRIKEAQTLLSFQGLGLKVWDGYRPLGAQWKFWDLYPDERFVSDPRKGGRHTRGTSVDLTLVDTSGNELPMPSLFDDFTERAHCDFQDCDAQSKQHRDLLQDVMRRHGFGSVATEWWHFDLLGWETFPVLT